LSAQEIGRAGVKTGAMKKHLLAFVMGALAFVLPAIASADSVTVVNLEKTPLKFFLRCGSGDWGSVLTLPPIDHKGWTCANSRVSLKIGTTNPDGSVTEKEISLTDGGIYALVKPSTNNYVALDMNFMVVVRNASSLKLNFTRACGNVEAKRMSVAAKDFTWIFAGNPPECSPYTASIETNANDGSRTTVARPMALGNFYTINWNGARQAWDIQAERSSGGAANSEGNAIAGTPEPRPTRAQIVAIAPIVAAPGMAAGSVKCGQYVSTGSVLTWQSFLNGSLHARGSLRITKVDGNYFEAIQTAENAGTNQTQMFGMINDSFIGMLNPNSAEAWIGNCSTSNIRGVVKQYTFTFNK